MLNVGCYQSRVQDTFPPHYLLNATFHTKCWMLPTRVQGTTRTPLLAECYISWMLQTRAQGTILPYTFPPHYLLNVTFHGCYTNQSSGHQTTIYTFPSHYLLNVTFHGCYQPEFRAPDYHIHISIPLLAECYISWMLPTRVQGTRLPYTHFHPITYISS